MPQWLLFLRIYATAQLTPSAVPTAARIADARFHKNLINLVLFSLVISLELKIKGFIFRKFFLNTETQRHKVFLSGAEDTESS